MPRKVDRVVESWWYVLTTDRKKEPAEQSRFLLRPLTGAERARVWDDHTWVTVETDGRKTISARGFQQARELVLSNVEKIENFPVGEPRDWPATAAERDRYIEMLDDMDVWELGNEIREHSTLEVAAKNS